MRPLVLTLLGLLVLAAGFLQPAVAGDDTALLERGAVIYNQRCALCHGPKGMGDGLLPIRIRDYPNTNLLARNDTLNPTEVRRAIEWGGFDGSDVNRYSPPWIHELSAGDMQVLTAFIVHLRRSTPDAIRLLEDNAVVSRSDGAALFQSRCALCHGNGGTGDGRMSNVITAPSPANLVASTLTRAELTRIIEYGGKAVGRSAKMPPWGEELSDVYIQRIVDHLFEIRSPVDGSRP